MWLQRLIKDRKSQVRYAGFSLLSSLVSQPALASLLVVAWSSLDPFGLWGICFKSALEVREDNLVRKQVVILNLRCIDVYSIHYAVCVCVTMLCVSYYAVCVTMLCVLYYYAVCVTMLCVLLC